MGQNLNRERRASPRLPRAFQVLWFGEAVSLFGTATTATLLSLLAATQLDAGPGWMGILAAASWSPWLILGLPAGALADRWPPRTTMIASDVVAATAAATVPLLWVTGTLSLAALVAVAFVIGSCAVLFRAALPRLVTRVVDADQLATANSMLYATESASTIVGPGLAGLIAQAVSAALGVLLDAISFLISAACLARIRPASRAPDHALAVLEESFIQRIRAGVTVVARDRYLRYFAGLAAVQNFGLTGLLTLQVLFLVDELAAPQAVTGLVLATGGVGGVIGGLLGPHIARRLGTARGPITLQLTSCSCLLVLLADPGAGVAWMTAGLLLCEFAIVADNVIRSTWRLTYVPDHLQARVSTTIQMLAFAAMPASGLASGWLGQQLGIRTALAIMLGIYVTGALTMPFGPLKGRRDLPTPPRPSRVLERTASPAR
ncbi:MFS transporter [Micromonospora parastrephiae]|uniref:MFS transporter n=1 Tax=Micromonospora parastrephiae TaxID=2806101 RepID=UPI0028162C21|nr:MFS transporter [Micromonospora parastrephiae]